MRKILFLSICLFTFGLIHANDFAPYKVKAQFIGGYIYPHDKNIISPLVKGPALGGEIAFEWSLDGSKPWHLHYNKPDIGVALQVLDLSNPQIVGQMIATYTYINIPMVKTNIVSFNTKIGGGLGFCTKPTDLAAAIADTRAIKDKAGDYNFAIGSPVNININAGLSLDIKVHTNISLSAEILYNHFSNGSLAQPNGGLNLFDGHIGLKYMPVYKEAPQQAVVTKPAKRWYGEFIVSGGAKKLYYKDTQYFGCASINLGGYYRTCNQHRIGIGVDLFYDGAYVPTARFDPNTSTYVDDNTYTSFGRTFITEDKIENKLRCGINIANDLIIGKFLIGFQAGIYLYDPIKNCEPYDDAKEGKVNKGLIYGYNIQKEDGWNYFRISAKYYITKHLLANISIKTHLQKVEFVEFGIGVGF